MARRTSSAQRHGFLLTAFLFLLMLPVRVFFWFLSAALTDMTKRRYKPRKPKGFKYGW